MNCHEAGSIILLRDGGDASDREIRNLEHHIGRCSDCASFAASLRPLPFAEVRSELPLGEEDFARIRNSVMSEVTTTRNSNWRVFSFRFAAIGATLLAILAVGVSLGRRHPEPSPVVTTTRATPTPIPIVVATSKPARGEVEEVADPPTNTTPREKIRPVTARPETSSRPPSPAVELAALDRPEPGPVRIELQTSDPNIRIIWISQNKSSEESSVTLEKSSDTR